MDSVLFAYIKHKVREVQLKATGLQGEFDVAWEGGALKGVRI
jgi:hypothetical protein